MDFIVSLAHAIWGLASAMGPYLLLGFVIAGLLHAFIPMSFVSRHLGGEGMGSVVKATLIGIPLPLCSCSVLPVSASLRNAGAGKAPTMSFLITTPVTGVDSLLATWALMGGIFTLARLGTAVVIGLVVGALAALIGISKKEKQAPKPPVPPAKISNESLGKRIAEALRYGLWDLPGMIAGSILAGLLIGGLITAVLPPDAVGAYIGTGVLGVLVATAVAVPLYICSTGSIPIAAAMMVSGFTPGAALAFLIAGPATNAVAITTVRKLLGGRIAILYLTVIFIGSLGFALLFDWLIGVTGWNVTNVAMQHQHQGTSLVGNLSAALLLGLLTLLYIKSLSLWKRWFRHDSTSMENKDMSTATVLNVPAMSCNHCKMTVTKALNEVSGVTEVIVNLDNRTIAVQREDNVPDDALIKALNAAGYEAEKQ